MSRDNAGDGKTDHAQQGFQLKPKTKTGAKSVQQNKSPKPASAVEQPGIDPIASSNLATALMTINAGLDGYGFELFGIFAHGEHPQSQDWCPASGVQFNLTVFTIQTV